MRTPILASSLIILAACESGPGLLKDPPILTVTSPQRSLIQDHAGMISVTGTVAPSLAGSPIASVLVNGVQASLAADGSFSATIAIPPGATLIHTVATDKDGGVGTDTRSVEAGDLRAPGANIDNALTAALSANAFAKLANAAGTLIATTDLKPLIAPMQPMVHSGDESGPDCLYAQLYAHDITMSAAHFQLVPVAGGLSFYAEIDNLDVPGHMQYAVACIDGNDSTEIRATQVTVAGTLLVTPNGMNGFDTQLVNPQVGLSGLDISASGVPGAILDILPLDSALEYIVPKVAGKFMGPMVNDALGALAGPKQVMALGKTIDFQVMPSNITFDPSGGLVVLNTQMLIEGAENSKGFIYTDNGMPSMDPGMGLQIGIADDLANEMVSQIAALGMLNMSMPSPGGTFDTTNLMPSSPPMISASPTDGKMQLVLPDMMATFTLLGNPVGKAAINAVVELKIVPAANGAAVSLQLGTPSLDVDVLPDLENKTGLTAHDLGTAVKIALDGQISTISALLGTIPLPQVAGIQLRNLSIGGDDGYVMVKGEIQ